MYSIKKIKELEIITTEKCISSVQFEATQIMHSDKSSFIGNNTNQNETNFHTKVYIPCMTGLLVL